MKKKMDTNSSREELRRKLKDKIRNKRNPNEKTAQLPQRLKDDPAGVLLSMGIDDASILNNVQMLLKDKHGLMERLAETVNQEKQTTNTTPPLQQLINTDENSDDEESPPP